MVAAQPEPATEQVQAKSPKEIIVRPATSALPRILCTTAIPVTTQQQPQTFLRSGTSSHGVAGSNHEAAAEPAQNVSRQSSTSTTTSADESARITQVKRETSHDCLTGAAQQQASASALGRQSKQQASFNTVTSGEYSHLTIRRQLSVTAALPAPVTQQPEAPAVDTGLYQAQPYSTFLVGEDGFSVSDLHRGSSHSFDSCYLPIGEMPDFDFEAGNGKIPQERFWDAGQDAQMPHAEVGVSVDAAPYGEAGSLTGQSKSWDWCNVMAQSLEQAPPCLPDLAPLPELPPSLCTSWEQQAWQASWQQQQHRPQDLHPHDQRQQFQHTPFMDTDLHSSSLKGAASIECMDSAQPSSGAEATWMMLPSCSMENMLQPDAALATGWLNQLDVFTVPHARCMHVGNC